MTDEPFKDNVVIITGASLGIGRELALQLADQGARLTLAARNREVLEAVAAQCRSRGGRALVVPADVGDEAQCQQIVARTVEEYGRIDTLVNNAALGIWARFDEMKTLDPLGQVIRVNYLGSAYMTYHALPYLKETRGRIAAVSSLAGKTGVPLHTGYAASKHALHGFLDSLRIELTGTGVTVTLICPGFVDTGIHERAFGPDGKPFGEGRSPVKEAAWMPVERCVKIMIRAMARRQREEVMTLQGKVGQWIKLIAPRLVDRMALQAIKEEP